MKEPVYNKQERWVLDAPEAFLLRRRKGIGSQRLESTRPINEGETPAYVWRTIVDLLALPPYNALGIAVYAVRGDSRCSISLKHCPWEK